MTTHIFVSSTWTPTPLIFEGMMMVLCEDGLRLAET